MKGSKQYDKKNTIDNINLSQLQTERENWESETSFIKLIENSNKNRMDW